MLTRTRSERPLQRAISTLLDAAARSEEQQAKLAALVREKFAAKREGEAVQITLSLEEYKKTFEL